MNRLILYCGVVLLVFFNWGVKPGQDSTLRYNFGTRADMFLTVLISGITYSSIELHKWRWGAVVQVRLQPSSLYVTVSDGCTCIGGEDIAHISFKLKVNLGPYVSVSVCICLNVLMWVSMGVYGPTEPLGQGTAAGRLNLVRGHQIPWVMVFGQPS